MFEANTIEKQRLTLLESVVHQLLRIQMQAGHGADAGPLCENLISNWNYRGAAIKDDYAAKLIAHDRTADDADRTWVEAIIRANSGPLALYGTGYYNAKAVLGNSEESYQTWLASLIEADAAVRDTSESDYIRDNLGGSWLPVLMLNTGDFLHLIVIAGRITIQSISLQHLQPGWDWDLAPGVWRSEAYAYVNNLSKADFIKQYSAVLMKTLKALAPDAEDITFYIPEGLDNDDVIRANLADGFTKVEKVALEEYTAPAIQPVAQNEPETQAAAANDDVADPAGHNQD